MRYAPDEIAALARFVRDGGVAVSTAGPVTAATAREIRSENLFVRSDPAQLAELVTRVDDGRLRLHITDRCPVSDLAAVHADARAGTLTGKTVLLAS